jgi:hypothetical protein
MPVLRALECKKAAFLTGAPSCIGKDARQVACARRPRALFRQDSAIAIRAGVISTDVLART